VKTLFQIRRKFILISNPELQDIQGPNNGTPARSLMTAHHFCDLSTPKLQKHSMLSHITTVSSQVIHLYTFTLKFTLQVIVAAVKLTEHPWLKLHISEFAEQ